MEALVLAPMQAWIRQYRVSKEKHSVVDKRRLEFDSERRASKLELKKVHQQQATDKTEPELMGKLEAKSGDVAGSLRMLWHASHVCLLFGKDPCQSMKHFVSEGHPRCIMTCCICDFAVCGCLVSSCGIKLSFAALHVDGSEKQKADLLLVVLQRSVPCTTPMSRSYMTAWQLSSMMPSLSEYI